MKKRSLGALIGFLLLAIGLISIVLNMTGLQLDFMSFMQYLSEGLGFLIYILMMISGGIIMYLSLSNWRG
ncbi:MAG: hypothetical protein GVX96_00490 [Bacteroidetes bacterium]|jgi:uncharacterized integral membrane protein|nr:hypothetical protein [Bacteroidota bacterium]